MGRKGKFNNAQDAHSNTYIDELVAKVDAGVRGIELTRWKQSAATKALASTAFEDLDESQITRAQWFQVLLITWLLWTTRITYLICR